MTGSGTLTMFRHMTDPTEHLLDLRWRDALQRDYDGAPLLSPLFVVEQGPSVNLVDLGSQADALGAAGFIPGSLFVAEDEVDAWAAGISAGTPLVLVSGRGRLAAETARRLESQGLSRIAALAGGLMAWRQMGLRTTRDPRGVSADLSPPTGASSPGKMLTLEDVQAHIGNPRTVRWTKMSSLVSHGRVFCVDGRDERGVIGAPGGDAGEFLLVLGALERATGISLDDAQVRSALQARLDAFGDFYMHTDRDALAALFQALEADDRTRGFASDVGELERRFEAAAPVRWPDWDAVREKLLDPGNVGCGHLRLTMQHSAAYGVRPELAAALLDAVHGLWREGAPEVRLTVLPGGHQEGAVVNVLLDEDPWDLSWVPLISPAYAGTQIFVNHPQVVARLRRVYVEYHRRGLGALPLDDTQAATFSVALEEMSEAQLTSTLGHLAKGLPVYEAVFAQSGKFRVRKVGAVPA